MSMLHTIEIIIRSFVAFLWLWGFIKLIGKQIINQNTNHLFVLSTILGTIAGNMAFNININFIYFLLSLFIMSVIGYLLTLISLKSNKSRKWISGEPTIIIKDGNLLDQNMKKCKYTLDSLEQGLRSKDIFDLKEVEYAVLETNGTLSVLKKLDYRNVMKKDLIADL
ncbi:DUF421 domain-containing protein [Paenibacillus alginolyticus]|uniref:DUF421 domain-containing protein n=2 Tax=Paenibacillus alginolyticus TaxID=59839 RepID=UPI000A079C3E|nr:YetF domain-containing protein [Paenibacillus alginolyticus]MCY9667113.1 DUF421 domain-containing protein [Paenibacillus alginolyticus]